MTARRRWTLWLVVDGSRLLVKGWRAGELWREGGWRPIYLGTLKAWMIDSKHHADVAAYAQHRGAVVVDQSPARTAPQPVTRPDPAFEVTDEPIGDLLSLIAEDERHEDDYKRFLAACRADADAHGGKVSVNRVRDALSNEFGLEVEPRRYASYWQRATKTGTLLNTEEWEVSTDTRGRNVGKPQRVREWRGWTPTTVVGPELDLFGEVVS